MLEELVKKPLYETHIRLKRYASLVAGLPFQDLLRQTLHFYLDNYGVEKCAIFILEPDGRGARLYALHHTDVFWQESGVYLSHLDEPLLKRIISKSPTSRTKLVSQVATSERDLDLIDQGLRSDFLVPLWCDSHCFGAVTVASEAFDGIPLTLKQFMLMSASTLSHSLGNLRLSNRLQEKDDAARMLTHAPPVTVQTDFFEYMTNDETTSASERFWQSIVKTSSDHLFLLNTDFIIQFINHDFANKPIIEMTGASLLMLFPKEFNPAHEQCLTQVMKTGVTRSIEISHERDGLTQFYEANVCPIFSSNEIIGISMSLRDITKRKVEENQLRQASVAVENTADAVLVSDVHANILTVNSAFTKITGYEKDDIIGKNASILKSGKHGAIFYQKMWASLKNNGYWQGEIWDRRKNGEIFPAWETISTVCTKDNKVCNYVSVFSDISAIKASQAQVNYLAYHDPLTNLPNRLLFNDRLAHALERASRDDEKVAVLFFDIDRFKNINDTLGHPVGDKLIRAAAERLTTCVRGEDTLARLGGDEFVIVMENFRDKHDVGKFAEKLLEKFSAPFIIDDYELHISLSIGVSLYPQNGDTSEALIKHADIAMYQVKNEGRNNYRFYVDEFSVSAFEKLSMETALRYAIARDELVLHYQPQYSLQTGTLVGAEALIRWEHKTLGLVYPSRFISLAEESGLIVPLGEWALQTACLQAMVWRQSMIQLPLISVNVSAVQLQRKAFFHTVESVLKRTGLPPACLELEITESEIMKGPKQAIELLDKIKALGVGLSIDDFGTGYSSLSYLKRLPVNKLKIDRSFIRDIPEDANDKAISHAVIALGKSLQLTVIAEGVENEAQRDFLKGLGCDEAQGTLFSPAVTVEKFEELLQAGGDSTSSH